MPQADPEKVALLTTLLASLDPFEISQTIEKKLEGIYQRASRPRLTEARDPQFPQPWTTIHREKEEAKKKQGNDDDGLHS